MAAINTVGCLGLRCTTQDAPKHEHTQVYKWKNNKVFLNMYRVAAAGHPEPLPHACFIHAHVSLVSSKYHADLEMERRLIQLGGFAERVSLANVHIS